MNKKLDLGKEKIGKLLLTFSIPCVISMLINSVYNIVDQIFIGQGVGYLGNAATNIIFPIVIMCNAIAGLIGNGCAANFSLRLGEGKNKEASKSVASTITITIITSILISIILYISLNFLVKAFGCTNNVFPYAMEYGKIILLGAPFMIIYSALSQIIRADGSPKYSMILLVVGAIINIILDPILIMKFNMGVRGGAIATIIGQIVSCIMALLYLRRFKSIKLNKKDFVPDKSIIKVLGYGLSSFITQMTVLALFIFMNNIMTKYGATSKFGSDIPLSAYGIVSKLNSLFVASVLGISIGAQPIIGFNFGAGNYKRVKETLRKVLFVNLIIGLLFNASFQLFTKALIGIFGSADNALYTEFATDCLKIFLMLCALNFFEMTTSIVIQSLGNVKKSTAVSFIRQIILFIPIALILSSKIGLYGALYAGPIADVLCFVTVIFIFGSEYKKLGKMDENKVLEESEHKILDSKNKMVITINREYGSGGRYVGKLLAEKLNIAFYDKELINEISKETGLSKKYIEENEQKKHALGSSEYNNEDALFVAESKVIKKVAKSSCVIVGRCADYVLENKKNTYNIFLYSSLDNEVKRAVKYYGLDKFKAEKKISKINKERAKHYKYYTGRNWKEVSNYDMCLNVDELGVKSTVDVIISMVKKEK